MKKTLFILVFTLILVMPVFVYAQAGCCSHHSGVCGCKCCDGASLSAICAPNYPKCNNDTVTTPEDTLPVVPTPEQPKTETTIPQEKTIIGGSTTSSNQSTSSSSDSATSAVVSSVVTAGLLGGGYWIYKKFKK